MLGWTFSHSSLNKCPWLLWSMKDRSEQPPLTWSAPCTQARCRTQAWLLREGAAPELLLNPPAHTGWNPPGDAVQVIPPTRGCSSVETWCERWPSSLGSMRSRFCLRTTDLDSWVPPESRGEDQGVWWEKRSPELSLRALPLDQLCCVFCRRGS